MDLDRADARYALKAALVPVAAVESAARALIAEWGENRRIATTGHVITVTAEEGSFLPGPRVTFYVFLCGASDGAFWWLASTVFGEIAYTSDDSGHTLDALRVRCEQVAREACADRS